MLRDLLNKTLLTYFKEQKFTVDELIDIIKYLDHKAEEKEAAIIQALLSARASQPVQSVSTTENAPSVKEVVTEEPVKEETKEEPQKTVEEPEVKKNVVYGDTVVVNNEEVKPVKHRKPRKPKDVLEMPKESDSALATPVNTATEMDVIVNNESDVKKPFDPNTPNAFTESQQKEFLLLSKKLESLPFNETNTKEDFFASINSLNSNWYSADDYVQGMKDCIESWEKKLTAQKEPKVEKAVETVTKTTVLGNEVEFDFPEKKLVEEPTTNKVAEKKAGTKIVKDDFDVDTDDFDDVKVPAKTPLDKLQEKKTFSDFLKDPIEVKPKVEESVVKTDNNPPVSDNKDDENDETIRTDDEIRKAVLAKYNPLMDSGQLSEYEGMIIMTNEIEEETAKRDALLAKKKAKESVKDDTTSKAEATPDVEVVTSKEPKNPANHNNSLDNEDFDDDSDLLKPDKESESLDFAFS